MFPSASRTGNRRFCRSMAICLAAVCLAVVVTPAIAQGSAGPTDAPANESPELPFDANHLYRRSSGEGNVVVYWAGEDNATGDAALEIAEETRRQLDLILPAAGGEQTAIYLFSSTAELREALQSAGLEWSSDLGDLQSDDIWATVVNPRTARQELGRSIPRQMIARRLAMLSSGSREALPEWFLSGLPGLFEQGADSGYDGVLREALAAQMLIPLSQLCNGLPADEVARSLAIAESASLLSFIRTQYGVEALGRLVGAYVAGEDCPAGISRSLGLSVQQLEEEWLAARFGQFSVGVFWRSNAGWLLLLLLGFLLSSLLLLPMRRQAGEEQGRDYRHE